MSELRVVTNHHWKKLVCWYDMPESARAGFDYLEDEEQHSCRFFCYRGEWYDAYDMLRIEHKNWLPQSQEAFAPWDAYVSDSFFSGVVVRWDGENEQVQVGTYLS